MKFEYTSLLKHPTVEKAFSMLLTAVAADRLDDNFVRQVIRPAEIISRAARNPDPDMLAASMLKEGLLRGCHLGWLEQETNPRVAAYYQWFSEIDMEKIELDDNAQRQIFLGLAIRGLDTLQVASCENYVDYNEIKKTLGYLEPLIVAAMQGTEDALLLEQALTKFIKVRDGLEEQAEKRRQALLFENTGLPAHPTVRGVYEFVKDEILKNDPFGIAMTLNVSIARLVVMSGASRDPDVIAVALLQSIYRTEEGVNELERHFSPRLAELYNASSKWRSFGRPVGNEIKDDAILLSHAYRACMLDTLVKDCAALVRDSAHFNKSSIVMQLERIESLREDVATDILDQHHPVMKARMESVVKRTDSFMHSPAAVQVRKPGRPPIHPGYDI